MSAPAPWPTITRLRLLELTAVIPAAQVDIRVAGDWWLAGVWHLEIIPLTPAICAGLSRRFPTIEWSKIR